MFLLTIIISGIFEIYLLSIIFRAKNVAKVQQIFQLCKFFAKKIYQQFLKVIQNKIVNRSFTAFYNFYNVEKFSKIKNHLFTSVFHCVSLWVADRLPHLVCNHPRVSRYCLCSETRAYCEEHFPAYFCSASDNWVSIRETKTGLSGEVRDLYITQLKDHNISAIDFKDPNEIEHNGRYRQSFTRSSLNDKGFSKDIREIVRHFQQEAIEQQTNR